MDALRNRKPIHNAGQAVVNLTLLLPLLFLILTGTLDLVRIFTADAVMTNAAREGARVGAENPTNPGNIIQTLVIAQANGAGYAVTSGMVTISTPDGPARGNPITVRVNYTYQLLTLFILGGAPMSVQTSATMLIW